MRIRCLMPFLLICLLAHGCSETEGQNPEWLVSGRHTLFGVASDEVPHGVYMPDEVWDEAAEEVRFDEENFPDWARDRYAACVYWKGEYTRREINHERRPGEPVQWELQGSARGWVLVGEVAPYILQLTIVDNEQEIVVVDAWDPPSRAP